MDTWNYLLKVIITGEEECADCHKPLEWGAEALVSIDDRHGRGATFFCPAHFIKPEDADCLQSDDLLP